jgi:hypothetical protein
MRRKPGLRSRFWVQVGLGSVTAALTVITIISREWIEVVFGVDPDHGSGVVEWGVVVALGAATVLLVLLARVEWQQALTGQPD